MHFVAKKCSCIGFCRYDNADNIIMASIIVVFCEEINLWHVDVLKKENYAEVCNSIKEIV